MISLVVGKIDNFHFVEVDFINVIRVGRGNIVGAYDSRFFIPRIIVVAVYDDNFGVVAWILWLVATMAGLRGIGDKEIKNAFGLGWGVDSQK